MWIENKRRTNKFCVRSQELLLDLSDTGGVHPVMLFWHYEERSMTRTYSPA